MAEKPKDHTQETIISETRKEKLNPSQTAKTIINPDQVNADQLGETMVTQSPVAEEEILADGTMETIMEPLPGSDTGAHHTRETAMLTKGGVGSTQQAPAPGQSSPPARTGGHEAKYEIIRSLGKGGFAWVYLVKNLSLDRLEAMKILNSELSEDEDVLNRFVREAKTSANFNHQNIVMVYEVQKRGSWAQFKVSDEIAARHREPFAFFTMSFVEGETATDLIKKGRLPQKEAVRIVLDACSALEYAHAAGVVHRDIKPDNILVDRKGMGIVMDFGIAKVADQTRKTAAGTFMGTARYVSPEQAMGREIDGRSDIYSLGVALYELSTGRVPFDSNQWMTVLYQHINEPPPAPEKFYGEIHRDLRAVILKMLEKKPENRFQTARDTFNALSRVYQSLGGEDLGTKALDQIDTRRDMFQEQHTEATRRDLPPPPVRTKIQKKVDAPKSKTPMLALAAVALVVLAGLGWFLSRDKPQPDPTPPPEKMVETTPEVDLPTGKLLIAAIPKGRLASLKNDKGEEVAGNVNLPHFIELPRGSYQATIVYEGHAQTVEAFVGPSVPLARVCPTFEVEAEAFLLEDLR